MLFAAMLSFVPIHWHNKVVKLFLPILEIHMLLVKHQLPIIDKSWHCVTCQQNVALIILSHHNSSPLMFCNALVICAIRSLALVVREPIPIVKD
jgi:hypothetical protein